VTCWLEVETEDEICGGVEICVGDLTVVEALDELFTNWGGRGYVGPFFTLDLGTLEMIAYTHQNRFQQRVKKCKLMQNKNKYVFGTVDEGVDVLLV
jgi:hypothetical protein